MTGGTICMRRSEMGFVPARGFLEAGMKPRPSFNDGSNPEPLEALTVQGESTVLQSLRTPVSAYERQVRYAILEFDELLDSSSIDAKGWNDIAKAIARNYQLFDAFVVLHGTDSLAYTCSALSFMLENLGKPVIFTGSQVPMMELQNDATDNLLGSLIIAGHFMIPEVCLFFNYELFRGNRATKTSASHFSAFSSPNHPPLATMSSIKTHVAWPLIYRPTHIHSFGIRTDLDTAHVACLRIFPGIRPEMVDGVLRLEGLRGLVLETFGAGNTPGGPDSTMTHVIEDAVRRGIIIVNVTQCTTGTVSALYAPATVLGRAGVVFGHDMTTEAALAKLSYLLAVPGLSGPEIVHKMSISIRGELNEHSKTTFSHPSSPTDPSPRMGSLAALTAAVNRGDLDAVQEVMRMEPTWLLNEADELGNTPLHHAATGPNLDILRHFLSQGASVHLRNRAGRTPLFLAASSGRHENVLLLRDSGAHLHASERGRAWLQSTQNAHIWRAAGLSSERVVPKADGER
ncbi:MAG: hypothetical protein M1838_000577 [Thelocarpon superellum]|nr:MAG: hypothetical protein M1838_000577 [Thelocarpon superellum]